MERTQKLNFIKKRMAELGLNQRSLALKAGLHQDAVRNFFSGKSKNFRADTSEKIMAVLESNSVTASKKLIEQDYADIAVYDVRASAGDGVIISDEQIIYRLNFRLEWLRRVTNAPLDMLAIISIDGDSMQPTLSPEDTVLIDMTQRRPNKDGIYVIRYDDTVLAKRVQIDPVRKLATILSDNTSYPRIDNIRPNDIDVIGRVLWIGRRV